MGKEQNQTILDLPKVIAVGIASPVATLLTSRFGIAGTLIGLALGAVILTVIVDVLKVYLARVPGAVTTIPGGFRKRSPLRNLLDRMRRPFSKFSSLAPGRRRSILIGSIAAAGISFLVGLSAVTALEVGVGKSLSCWVWNECTTESSSTEAGSTSTTSTLPSVLGGGSSVSIGEALEVRPLEPQQQPIPPSDAPESSGASKSSSAPESSGASKSSSATKSPSASQPPSSETPQGLDSSGAGDQREDQYPPREEKDQESPSYSYSEEDQESPSYSYSEEDQQPEEEYQQPEEEYQQPEEEYQQQSTPGPTDEASRLDTESKEEQSNGADSD